MGERTDANSPMMTSELASRMKSLFRALYRDNEGERNNAASIWYRFLVDNKLHPNDFDLLVGSGLIEKNQQVISNLEQQIARLARENAYFRQQASADTVRLATVAGEIDPTSWTELYERLIIIWGDPLPVDWHNRLATLASIPLHVIKQWELGLAEVPSEVINKIVPAVAPDPISVVPEASPRSPRQRNVRRRRVTAAQLDILRALDEKEMSIRQLSFHLYEEPDTNENLADAVSNLVARNWLSRRHVDRSTMQRRTKWLYTLADEGRQVMQEVVQDQAPKENGSG